LTTGNFLDIGAPYIVSITLCLFTSPAETKKAQSRALTVSESLPQEERRRLQMFPFQYHCPVKSIYLLALAKITLMACSIDFSEAFVLDGSQSFSPL
jgi:hypothetical protein